MGDDVEDVKRRLAELSVEVKMLKRKYTVCIEAVARLREELENLKRRAGRPGLRGYMEALGAYERVEAGEPGPP